MCNLGEGVYERGIEKGIEQGKLIMVAELLQSKSEEEVKSLLKVTDVEIQKAKKIMLTV